MKYVFSKKKLQSISIFLHFFCFVFSACLILYSQAHKKYFVAGERVEYSVWGDFRHARMPEPGDMMISADGLQKSIFLSGCFCKQTLLRMIPENLAQAWRCQKMLAPPRPWWWRAITFSVFLIYFQKFASIKKIAKCSSNASEDGCVWWRKAQSVLHSFHMAH